MALPSIISSPEIRYLLAGILILTGLALAFWGHGLWATVMSMIGALLGAVVGYLFGASVYGFLGGRAQFTAGQLDAPLIAAILVLIVVFGISYYYIDDIIGIITAAIG